ncbi:hypothetical protein QR680_017592 [Steinernema hermaphroditum]|uniref:G-protein coupled receptors family 1 profile domain-containing protein n=1 Tax=Steinernema hermaphroditum TaxID=289476 RepID=A0AA39HHI6_9BILA|nr:hypothetical protein QR680_017592 [Steinernema hermaphroditum]
MSSTGEAIRGDMHSLVVSVVTNLLIVLVIHLSLRIPSGDLCRLYTLFVFVGYFPFEIFQTFRQMLTFCGLIQILVLEYPTGFEWLEAVEYVLRGFAQTQYKILAVFMVFLNFFLYRRPIAFGKYFSPNNMYRGFQVGWVIIATITLLGIVVTRVATSCCSAAYYVLHVLMMCLQLCIIVPFAVMLLFYFMALSAIFAYRKKQALQGISQVNQRKQLMSVLIYCTPPNIMNSPNFFLAFFNAYRAFSGTENDLSGAALSIYDWLYTLEIAFVRYRMIVITICTVLAFEPYRKAAFTFLHRRRKVETTHTPRQTTVHEL